MMSFAVMLSDALFLLVVAGIPIFGHVRKVPVFDTFLVGAKEGFGIVVQLIPILVGMLVGISMLRASGAFTLLAQWLGPLFHGIGIDADLLPLIITRPFSGAASNAALVDIIHHHGGDALISHTAATMIGSTETTFYIVAVYFASIQIRKLRHAVVVGLLADAVGIVASVCICRALLH